MPSATPSGPTPSGPTPGDATPGAAPIVAAILAGPTACGKTALAVALAAHLPIEVVSADSRQIYRHLKIGTAQPTAAEQQAVPHHLVDFLELDETYNVTRFTTDALQLFGDIRRRGNIPLVVGGAGFYLKVLREGLFDSPFDQEDLQRVRREVATWNTERLIDTLQELDADRLAAIHPNDHYRLSRAVEICLAAGRNVTSLTRAHQPPRHGFLEFRMTMPRQLLHERIAERTRAMLQQGWVEELRALLERFDASLVGFRTLGYPHVLAHLRGDCSLDELHEKIVIDTRRLARHQEVWFRKTRDATLLPVDSTESTTTNLATNIATLRRALEACPDLHRQ
jgi:tRNA dimethylallyltransferase